MTRAIFLSALLSIFAVSCSRSSAFRQEHDFYEQDSAFHDRKAESETASPKYADPKKKIYVLPFFNDTPFGKDNLGVFVSDELTRLLQDSRKLVIPENLRSAVVSRDFYSGNKVKVSSLAKEGKRLGVNLVVIGKIRRVIYRQKDDDIGLFRRKKAVVGVDLEIRLFDVIHEKEVFFHQKLADSANSQFNLFRAESDDPKAERMELVLSALRDACESFQDNVLRALEKMSWEGRIAKIGVGKVFLTAGRASGLNIGDILKVVTAGEDIYDPLTGDFLGKSQGQVKGTLEVQDYLGTDGAVAAIHSGGNFRENDVVRLY